MEAGGAAALASPAAILHAAAPAALLKGEAVARRTGKRRGIACRRRRCRSPRTARSCLAPLSTLPAGASLAGAAIQTALLGRWAGSTTLAAYAAVNVVTRLATLLAFSFFVDAAAARLSRALGRRDAVTARSQVGVVGLVICAAFCCGHACALSVALALPPDHLDRCC